MASDPRLKTTAHARVTLTVEVDCPSGWGEKCDIEQTHSQASREALSIINRAFDKRDSNFRWPVRVIGEPVVQTIIVKSER